MLLDSGLDAVRVAATGHQKVRRRLERLAQPGKRAACGHLRFVLLDQAQAPLRDAHKSGQLDLAVAATLAEDANPLTDGSHTPHWNGLSGCRAQSLLADRLTRR